MRIFIYILFLLPFIFVTGQTPAVHQGSLVYDNGTMMRITPDMIPPPSGQSSEEPEEMWNVIVHIDFSEIDYTDNLTISDLEDIWPYTRQLGGENDGIADDAETMLVDGDTVLRHHFLINQCCTEVTGPMNGGTGITWDSYINSEHTGYEHGYYMWKWFANEDFASGHGGKMFRVRSDESSRPNFAEEPYINADHKTRGVSIGWMHLDWNGSGWKGQRLQWYNYVHETTDYTAGWDGGRGKPDTITRGEWHKLVIRFWLGTPGYKDGFTEMFVNDTLRDSWTNVCLRDSIGVKITQFEIATFAGGSDEGYNMISTSYIDTDDIRFFQAINGDPAYNVPSSPGRVLRLPDDW